MTDTLDAPASRASEHYRPTIEIDLERKTAFKVVMLPKGQSRRAYNLRRVEAKMEDGRRVVGLISTLKTL